MQSFKKIFSYGSRSDLNSPLSRSRLMLLTSSGHFVAGNDPNPLGVENMTRTQAEQRIVSFIKAPPALSAIPVDTPTDRPEPADRPILTPYQKA